MDAIHPLHTRRKYDHDVTYLLVLNSVVTTLLSHDSTRAGLKPPTWMYSSFWRVENSTESSWFIILADSRYIPSTYRRSFAFLQHPPSTSLHARRNRNGSKRWCLHNNTRQDTYAQVLGIDRMQFTCYIYLASRNTLHSPDRSPDSEL